MKELRGCYVVNITPMTEEQEIDLKGLKENLDWYIREGIAGICVLGSTGEFVSLTREERLKVAETAVEHIDGRVPCIVGTSAETTRETIEYTRHAKDIGADAVMIINPYYYNPTDDETYEHFKAVSRAVDIPIMVYNNPYTAKKDMSPQLIARLCQLDNVDYVKDASMEIRRVREIQRLDNRIKVHCGTDDLAFESFVLGAIGWISVCANIIPAMSQKLFDLVWDKKIDEAKELYWEMLPLLHVIEQSGKLVQVVKAAMNKMGRPAGPCRLPRLPLTPEEDAELEEMLKKMDLI